jgi:hypothetical protein
MKNRTNKQRGKKGQTKRNRQWVKEHGLYWTRLPYGAIDQMTGKVKT